MTASGAPETEWLAGHQSEVRPAHNVERVLYRAGDRELVNERLRHRRRSVFPPPAGSARRSSPHTCSRYVAHGVDAVVVQAVQAPRPLGAVGDEPGLLEQPQVPRHRRTARSAARRRAPGPTGRRRAAAPRSRGDWGHRAPRTDRRPWTYGNRRATVTPRYRWSSTSPQPRSQRRPEAVWAVLIDAAGYSGWDSGLVRVEGRIAPQREDQGVRRSTPSGPSRSR